MAATASQTMDYFTNPIPSASPSNNVTTPVSIQSQLRFSATESISDDQDRRELEAFLTENADSCDDLDAFLIQKADLARDEFISVLMKILSDEKLLSDCHGFHLLTNIHHCIKHLACPTEVIAANPHLQRREESAICRLVSCLQEIELNMCKVNAPRVLLASKTHACEVTGTTTDRIIGEKEPVNAVLPAIEKEERMSKPLQLDKTENQNPGMDSSSEEEAELEPHVEVNLKSDAEIDIEYLHNLMHQIRDLQIYVKERREWAQEKALQAATKVSDNFMELTTLRTIREINERMKKEKKEMEDGLASVEAGFEEVLKITEENVERNQVEVRRLKKENKEMRAEIEAARLELSETNKKCKRIEKGLKRNNKSAEISKKQMFVLQAEVEEAKKINVEIEEHIEAVRKEISASEAKLEEEKKLKQQLVKLVEAESKTTLSTKNSTQTRLTILTRKQDLDRRRHCEQVKALELEILCLTRATSPAAHSKLANLWRPCIFCKVAEASVLFLPCAHQLLCAKCGKDDKGIGTEKCPGCRAKVEQKIFVYGLGV